MSYHKYHTDAFVLGSSPFGEGSKTLSLFTRELGLLAAFASNLERLTNSIKTFDALFEQDSSEGTANIYASGSYRKPSEYLDMSDQTITEAHRYFPEIATRVEEIRDKLNAWKQEIRNVAINEGKFNAFTKWKKMVESEASSVKEIVKTLHGTE